MQSKKKKNYPSPDSDSLHQHLLRTNYITYCQQHYNLYDHPSPISNGWKIQNGRCHPVRYLLAAMPDLIQEPSTSDNSDNDSPDTDDEDTEYENSTDSSEED